MDVGCKGICGLALLAAFACGAEELPPEEPFERLRPKIVAVVEAHARTVGCSVRVDPRHVVPWLRPDGRRLYIALYHADIGCSGGNAMSRPVLVVVHPGAYGTWMIDTRHSMPQQTPETLPKEIIALVPDGDELRFAGLMLGPAADAACCPTQPVEGRVRLKLDAEPPWSVVP